MQTTGADVYGELEGIWKSRPFKIKTPAGWIFPRRTELENKLTEILTLGKSDLLKATQLYCIIGVNTGIIKDTRAAKTIHTIIGEVLEDV